MLLSTGRDSECCPVLRIEISNVFHVQRPVFVGTGDEETRSVFLFRMLQCVKQHFHVMLRVRTVLMPQALVFRNGFFQSLFFHRFQDIIYAVHRKSPDGILVIGRGKNIASSTLPGTISTSHCGRKAETMECRQSGCRNLIFYNNRFQLILHCIMGILTVKTSFSFCTSISFSVINLQRLDRFFNPIPEALLIHSTFFRERQSQLPCY